MATRVKMDVVEPGYLLNRFSDLLVVALWSFLTHIQLNTVPDTITSYNYS